MDFKEKNFDFPQDLNLEKLAFIGDAVFELIVRSKSICNVGGRIGNLNEVKVKNVCCSAQSELFESIKDILTEEELLIFKRGRNAHIGNVPKNISPSVYHRATGVEVLFGFWYVNGNYDKLETVSQKINL